MPSNKTNIPSYWSLMSPRALTHSCSLHGHSLVSGLDYVLYIFKKVFIHATCERVCVCVCVCAHIHICTLVHVEASVAVNTCVHVVVRDNLVLSFYCVGPRD